MALTAGTPFTIDANGATSMAVAKLSATASIVVYNDSTATDFECRVVQDDETVGAADTIETAAQTGNNKIAVGALSATKAIVSWTDSASGAQAGIITISGTTATFESGSVITLNNASDGGDGAHTMVGVSSSAAIMTYTAGATYRGVYLTVSGTTITEESAATIDGDCSNVSAAKLSSTKSITSYTDGDDSTIAKACVLSVSGTTISAGTPQNLEASDVGVDTALAEISSTQALCAYSNDTDDALEAVVLSVSGTTITVNTPTTVDTWTEPNKLNNISLAAYSTTQFVLAYGDQMADITVSGTTVTDNGTSTLTSDTVGGHTEAVSFSSTKAIVIYEASAKGVIVTAAATTWGYDVIPSASGNAKDSFCVAADGAYLFFALEDDTTGNQGVFRVVRPTSTTPTTALQYDPGGGSAGNVFATGDRNKMIFSGNFGTDIGVIDHDIDMGTNTDISPSSIGTDIIAPVQVDPGDPDHIVAVNKTDEDMLETEDNGTTWSTLQATLGVQVVAMALALFGKLFPFGGFIGGNDGTDEHLAYSPNEFANQREDTSTALKAVGSITGIDISLDID